MAARARGRSSAAFGERCPDLALRRLGVIARQSAAEQRSQLALRAHLELTRSLARDAEAAADFGQRQLVVPIRHHATLDDEALALVQLDHREAHRFCPVIARLV